MTDPLDRESVLLMFLEHAPKLDAREIAPGRGPYTAHLTLKGQRYYALVLLRSSEYWGKRIHTYKHSLTLLIVYEHDSCIPFPVLCLKDGHLYDAYALTKAPTKRNRYTASILLGQLMCGSKDAYDLLEHIPWQTKYR